jgi:hypothetical protein
MKKEDEFQALALSKIALLEKDLASSEAFLMQMDMLSNNLSA